MGTMNNKPKSNSAVIHNRRSVRLKGYNYSQAGSYFITLCTRNRECLFGDIIVRAGSKPAPGVQPARMSLNEYGEIVKNVWDDLINHVTGVELDVFGIMPNHIHGIVTINRAGLEPRAEHRAGLEPAPTGRIGLPEIIRQLKTFSARQINVRRRTPGVPLWQRNYYEHIIQNEKSYGEIATYIANNPTYWEIDRLYVRPNT